MRDYYTNTLEDARAFAAHYAERDDDISMSDVDWDEPDLERSERKEIRNTVHRARKDHVGRTGRVLVRKGKLYRLRVFRCRRMERDNEDEVWEYTRWLEIFKRELPVETDNKERQ